MNRDQLQSPLQSTKISIKKSFHDRGVYTISNVVQAPEAARDADADDDYHIMVSMQIILKNELIIENYERGNTSRDNS